MKKKIPLISIIIGIALIIGGGIFVWQYSDQESLFGRKSVEKNFKDSDNDGLRDWEEELYRSDPNNPDTDGDGYLDGEEVDSGHNPIVKSPGDKLDFYPLPLGEKYNLTQKVLDEETMGAILEAYVLEKGEYIMDHPEVYSAESFAASVEKSTLEEISKRAVAEAFPQLLEKTGDTISEIPEIFDIKVVDQDINITEDNNQEAIKLYLSQVSLILNSDIFFLQDQTFQALTSAFKNNDFFKLDQLIKENDIKIEYAKSIIVPSSWKEIHKKGLELTLLIRNIFVSFRDIPNDPIKAQIALLKFENFADNWNDLMEEAIDLAKSQNIELSL